MHKLDVEIDVQESFAALTKELIIQFIQVISKDSWPIDISPLLYAWSNRRK